MFAAWVTIIAGILSLVSLKVFQHLQIVVRHVQVSRQALVVRQDIRLCPALQGPNRPRQKLSAWRGSTLRTL